MNPSEAMAVLARTPTALDALLSGFPEHWLHRDDGPGTWSAYDIVGHLVHGDETDWLPRIRMVLEHGTSRPFEPFDREAMLGGEPQPISSLLAGFAATRQDCLTRLSSLHLSGTDLDRRGLHPDLGEVTVANLLASWVAHDLTHLAQAGEVLARHYRDAVGPFRRYLPALDRVAAAE